MKNNKRIILLIAMIAICISSCTVLSFYPFYTSDVLIKNDIIIGKWETYEGFGNNSHNDTLIWEISFKPQKLVKKNKYSFVDTKKSIKNKFTYTLIIYDKKYPLKQSEFDLHLFKLNNETFVDFFPKKWTPSSSLLAVHLIGVHTCAKIEIKDQLTLRWFNYEWFAKKLEENKIRIKHEKNKNDILLTAKSKDLQKFILKYSKDPKAYEDGFGFELKKIR